MMSGRSLDFEGVKTVEMQVANISATTHSYTVFPNIRADGTILRKIFVTFYEPNIKTEKGVVKIPKIFFDDLEEFTHTIIPKATKSGLMTSELSIEWFHEQFMPVLEDNSLLLLDSWTGYKQMLALPAVRRKNLRVEIIPPGLTPTDQPLDVGFNHYFKDMMRKLSEKIRRRERSYKLHLRKNIATLICVVWYQFVHPRFHNFVKHAWSQAGYIERPAPYDSPTDYCLKYPIENFCQNENCESAAFMRCAHCEKVLCMFHTITELHIEDKCEPIQEEERGDSPEL